MIKIISVTKKEPDVIKIVWESEKGLESLDEMLCEAEKQGYIIFVNSLNFKLSGV